MSNWTFFCRTLIAAAVIVGGLLIWQLSQALLLFFGAILIGVLLSGASGWIAGRTPLPRLLALTAVVLLIVAIIAAIGVLFGTQISNQLAELGDRLPAALNDFGQRIGIADLTARIEEQISSNTGSILSGIAVFATSLISVLSNMILIVVAAVFLAAQPDLYRNGALKLFPEEQQPELADTMDISARALRQWLLGQLISMLIVGSLVAIGLSLIGIPSPLALGLIAGVAEFVPLIGPIFGAIPALVLAFSQDWSSVIWTGVLFIAIQQIESNMITPLIQRRMVLLPPVLTLFAIVCFTLLFGPLGLIFATPLAVVTYVFVTRLYIRELLQEPAEVPGEKISAPS